MFEPRINPNFTHHWDGPILVVENFLENIDEFRDALFAHGDFQHRRINSQVVDVGPQHNWRQLLAAELFPQSFNDAITKLQMVSEQVATYGTNCFYSDMKIENKRARAANYPHSDHVPGQGLLPIVFNLWLHDGGGGTGFYKYDGYHTASAMPIELRYFAENHTPVELSAAKLSADSKFRGEFNGDETWELWKVAEMKKNRAFIYCGDFWHRVLIPENEFQFPNPRFSFLSFNASSPDSFIEASGSRRYLRPDSLAQI